MVIRSAIEFHCSISRAGIGVLGETLDRKQFIFYALDPVAGMGSALAKPEGSETPGFLI